ncbi:NAD-dependent epimerase/dehydratase family protein [Mucilaginibacter sp.]|uniref:NAD-dependent epimerase/dehydratase family protein n=1 Tax=Mucilaginibacter sp. TaxID=1882438 RepID=UPI0025CCB8BD|nr:NAD-dependent epimerase/dehydratase family protein [Mucilaginibacter sp.]
MSKILISGSNGFVGVNLSNYLAKAGNEIYTLSRNAGKQENDVLWNDLERISEFKIDVFIHLAGKAHDLKNTSEPDEYFKVNTDLTIKLFNQFLKSTASVFIYFSTVKAAADTVENILNEDVVPNPKTVYGQSKFKAEQYLLAQTLPPEKKLYILRPCMIHGPGNKGNLNLLYRFVSKGIPYPFAAFENKRSFLSISNLCFIVEKLAGAVSPVGGVYNIADDVPLSTNEVIMIIAETNNLKSKLWKINRKLIEQIAFVGDKLRLPINTERLKKLTENYVVSNSKIKKALAISHLPISSADGLKSTISSFQNQ